VFITNAEELVDQLKPRLREYLVSMVGEEAQKKKFCCYVHNEDSPSMAYNPKTGFTTVHCFGCGVSHDIFSACAHLEGLPAQGPDWMKITLPHLAQKLGVEVKLGEPSPTDRAKGKLYKLTQDMTTVLAGSTSHLQYMQERSWSDNHLVVGSIAIEELTSKLLELGWTHSDLQTSMMLETSKTQFFGEHLVTFAIRDYRGRPVGFVSRNLKSEGAKYVNTPETLIYEKRNSLLGIDIALKQARQHGLYLVEGPGDLAALHSIGVVNAAAICGTAFTASHLELLKMLGIRKVYFALDWDKAGSRAVHRILKEELKFAPGVSCYVVSQPDSGETDPGELIETIVAGLDKGAKIEDQSDIFHSLGKTPAFEWVLARLGADIPAEDVCAEMVPIIASEETAVRRELFCSALSQYTGISHQAIDQDVRNIRDSKTRERNDRLLAAGEAYWRGLQSDPGNIVALMAEHESHIEYVEKEFGRESIGVNYQLSKYEALQEQRARQSERGVVGEFTMKYYTIFAEALSGGGTWVDGVLTYVGGRENSGKTALCIALGIDVALHDDDAIVVMHFTDDSFAQVEPRLKTNIALMTKESTDPTLTIGMANDPNRRCNAEEYGMYQKADNKLRNLIAEERLVFIDMEDGSTLSTLEKNLRHIRRRHPEKKLLVICDNTHNYMDYLQLDQPTRMTRISNHQKIMTGKYHCAMIATAEYRKNSASDTSKMKLPTNDDLADARALKYRPNMIIHVYNDLNDRMDDAEIFHTSDAQKGVRLPRLMLVISKNKISKFKDKLMMDLDIDVVGLRQVVADDAREDAANFWQQRKDGEVKIENGTVVEAEWE